ncbi:MAG: Pantothenate synthetase [Bacteroidota bacterium]|nr:Pantothenate synthetase [Bacteroidota bacterium]
MKVFSTTKKIQNQINILHIHPVGFVPTMGALHEGHISLVINAISECPRVVVSIYVNPTQFNNKEDLKNYPRTIKADLEMLGKVLRENDIVFTPDDKEIYPEEDTRIFHFGNLDNVMEALHRPGHFTGVAKVVSRLFDIIQPDVAFFGMKDFQQIAVIRELVRQKRYNIRIEGIPIIREPDGLAMSSRNRLLDPEIRKEAPVIYTTLSAASALIIDHDISYIKNFVIREIGKSAGFSVEYFEIVDDMLLIPVQTKKKFRKGQHYFGCIAVKAGKIRLIDNIEFPLV